MSSEGFDRIPVNRLQGDVGVESMTIGWRWRNDADLSTSLYEKLGTVSDV